MLAQTGSGSSGSLLPPSDFFFVFVDRVLYGGPGVQRVALGSLAAATAVGALASGFLVRVLSLRLVTIIGLVASAVALLAQKPLIRAVCDTVLGIPVRRTFK